ncbi:MAG: substrate-binding domain-containing protein [Methanophagales archaeon]|nr:substrate-binding domain-containing protein [Methanophagales archaeon]
MKDKRGVSPAIASLVLIVIAVVAAAGVGVITNTLNTQTGEQAEGQDLSIQGAIDMQGSTTVLPFALAAAATYMEDHPAVEISASGGGSGHGKTMAKLDKVDIGMASSRATSTDIIQDGGQGAVLYETEIGKRMIVVIANDGANTVTWNVVSGDTCDLTNGTIAYDDLVDLYNDGSTAEELKNWTAYQRNDVSGTEEGFAKWIGLDTGDDDQLPSGATAVQGNPGVWTAVTGNDESIGFVDLGYLSDEKYGASQNGTAPEAAEYDDYETASKALGSKALTSKLYYYTHGVPSGATKAFVDFCLSTATDEGQDILEDVGMIPL